jgi:Ig-like domain from next to BRCA1 gene
MARIEVQMKTRIFLLIGVLLMAACGGGTPEATPTSVPTIAVPTSTVPATAIAATATPFPTLPAFTDTPTTGTETAATPGGPVVDRAAFIDDVTVPDGTDFAPGASFTKTWRVRNAGTSTWTTAYAIEFVNGTNSTNMATVTKVNLPNDVAPGATVDISVNMVAPSTLGSYTSLWQFVGASGNKFGVGPNFNELIYLQIDVITGGATSGGGVTAPAPTASGPLNPAKVVKASLTVDTANVLNDCPHTFVFRAVLNIEGGGVVKYQLEAVSNTSGFAFDLPAPIESTFTTNGPHTFGVNYTLEMRNAVSGEAWLHVLSPNELTSERVPFSLTCPATSTAVPFPTGTPAASATP